MLYVFWPPIFRKLVFPLFSRRCLPLKDRSFLIKNNTGQKSQQLSAMDNNNKNILYFGKIKNIIYLTFTHKKELYTNCIFIILRQPHSWVNKSYE